MSGCISIVLTMNGSWEHAVSYSAASGSGNKTAKAPVTQIVFHAGASNV
jgi:hypothetical protein